MLMRGENEPVIERQLWVEDNIRFRNVCLIYSLVAVGTVCSFKKCCQTLLVKEENFWPVKVLFRKNCHDEADDSKFKPCW